MMIVKLTARLALAAALLCLALLLLALVSGRMMPGDGIIALVSTREGNREIALIDVHAPMPGMFNLTHNPAYDYLPRWLPDGQTLAFNSFRDNHPGIYTLSVFGSQVSRVRDDDLFEAIVDWSPDGEHIAFIRYYYTSPLNESPPGLYILDTATEYMRYVGNLAIPDASGLRWSSDSRRIALISNHEGSPAIYVMPTDGRDLKRVTQMQVYSAGGLSWSPGGERIAFSGYGSEGIQIFTVDLNDGSLQQLTHVQADLAAIHPSWSPDGRRIAFVGTTWGVDGGNLYVIDADGGNLQLVTTSAIFPIWRPLPLQ